MSNLSRKLSEDTTVCFKFLYKQLDCESLGDKTLLRIFAGSSLVFVLLCFFA